MGNLDLCRGAANRLWSGPSTEKTAVYRHPAARDSGLLELQAEGSPLLPETSLGPQENKGRCTMVLRRAAPRAGGLLVLVARVHPVGLRRFPQSQDVCEACRRLHCKRTK